MNYIKEINHTFMKNLIFLNSLYQWHLAENDFFCNVQNYLSSNTNLSVVLVKSCILKITTMFAKINNEQHKVSDFVRSNTSFCVV